MSIQFPASTVHEHLHVQQLASVASGRESAAIESPAILQIGQQLLDHASHLTSANQNIELAMSRSQTTASFLEESRDVVQRLRELSVQAANGALRDADRQGIHAEAQELVQLLNGNAEHATFNGQPVLQGGTTELTVSADGDVLSIHNGDVAAAHSDVAAIDLRSQGGAVAAIDLADAALNRLGEQLAVTGSDQRVLVTQLEANRQEQVNVVRAGSSIVGTDMASAMIEATSSGVLAEVGVAMQTQAMALNASMASTRMGA